MFDRFGTTVNPLPAIAKKAGGQAGRQAGGRAGRLAGRHASILHKLKLSENAISHRIQTFDKP